MDDDWGLAIAEQQCFAKMRTVQRSLSVALMVMLSKCVVLAMDAETQLIVDEEAADPTDRSQESPFEVLTTTHYSR